MARAAGCSAGPAVSDDSFERSAVFAAELDGGMIESGRTCRVVVSALFVASSHFASGAFNPLSRLQVDLLSAVVRDGQASLLRSFLWRLFLWRLFLGRSSPVTVFARRGHAALDYRFFEAKHFEFVFPVGMNTTTAPRGGALM